MNMKKRAELEEGAVLLLNKSKSQYLMIFFYNQYIIPFTFNNRF